MDTMRPPVIPRLTAICTLALCLALVAPVLRAQPPDMTGVWMQHGPRSSPHELYGELRIVTQTSEDVFVSMVDYDHAAGIIRILPWRFRFGEWGPRRGANTSGQPRTRARWSGERLVLVKAPGEPGGLTWVWSLDQAPAALVEYRTDRSWTSDFAAATLTSGQRFTRAPSANACQDCTFVFGEDEVTYVRDATTAQPIALRLADEQGAELVATCVVDACIVKQLWSNRVIGTLPLNRGQSLTVRSSSETSIEPRRTSQR